MSLNIPLNRTKSLSPLSKRFLFTLCLILSLSTVVACSNEDSAQTLATLEGRIEHDGGNQFTGSTQGSAAEGFDADAQVVTIARITPLGQAEVLFEGRVDASGHFQVQRPDIEGPLLVQVHESSAQDVPMGRALVLASQDGRDLFVAPISPETSAEADTFLALVAAGHPFAEIDAIALMANISAEMASEIESREVLAAAVWDAQVAWLSVASEDAGQSVSASQAQSAKLEAWAALVAELEASPDPTGESSAWTRYELDAEAVLFQSFGLRPNQQLTAWAASAIALKQSVESSGESSAAVEVTSFLGMWREAEVSWMAASQIAAEGASAEASAAIDSAFSAYSQQLAAASSMDTVVEAQAELFAALVSTNPSEPSVMATLMQGETDLALPIDLESLGAVLDASAELELELAASLQVAAGSSQSADLTAKTLLSYRAKSLALVNSLTISLYGQASLDLLETSLLMRTQALFTTSSH
ncbi:MAG: hypothetical protein CO108_02885 [Deltaproteobacteria bacterium CG_4_9_14_3_um_filter_63_12]|nr:MAG: hypothetical protein CO108_02885 [Deltaproteobacteria bacterium CG_4_9_14_3_um_filter_63_12]